MLDLNDRLVEHSETVLTDIEFHTGNYLDAPDSVELKASDNVFIKKKNKNGFVLNAKRSIKPSTGDFFSFDISFDTIWKYSTPFDDENYASDDDILSLVINNQSFFVDSSMAKISMMISFISSQIGDGTPMITPPIAVLKKNDN